MYAGPDFPPGGGAGPAVPPAPPPRPASLRLHLAVLLFPLSAGVLTGLTIPLVLALDPDAGWDVFGSATLAALLLSAPAAHSLAGWLVRRPTSDPQRAGRPSRH